MSSLLEHPAHKSADKRGTHGMEGTGIYRVWADMLSRCNNSNHHAYADYGERGIKVCERWHSFENFYADMGSRPHKFTLERKDNEKGYCPENCVWASRRAQANNRRNNRLINYNGEMLPAAEAARRAGLRPELVHDRLTKGWTMPDLLRPARMYQKGVRS